MSALPEYEYLIECFDYNFETGEFTWKERPMSHFKTKTAMSIINSRLAGKSAGSQPTAGTNNRCSHVRLLGQYYSIKKIIWKLVNRNDPNGVLKFKDGNSSNLRYDNLVYRFQNTQSSGYKWVVKNQGKYCANIMHEGVKYYLGSFDTPDQAHNIALLKKEELSQLSNIQAA
jgi:hypothetical protein